MIKVICGTTLQKVPESLKKEVEDILLSKGQEISWMVCSSKQHLEYAVSQDGDAIVLIQERDTGKERYEAWEIASIRDIKEVRVIACVERIHYGTPFMSVLYAGEILDALYEDEADPLHIAERLIAGRDRGDCRKYYGIGSLEEVISVLQVMDQPTLDRYVRFINGGVDREEILERYHEVSRKLNQAENACLAQQLPENIVEEIRGDAVFGKYRSLQSVNEKRGASRIVRK